MKPELHVGVGRHHAGAQWIDDRNAEARSQLVGEGCEAEAEATQDEYLGARLDERQRRVLDEAEGMFVILVDSLGRHPDAPYADAGMTKAQA